MNFNSVAAKVQKTIKDLGVPLVYRRLDDDIEYNFVGVMTNASDEETSFSTTDPTKIIVGVRVCYIGPEFPVVPVVGDIISDRVRDPELLSTDFIPEFGTEWKVMKVEPYEAKRVKLGWKVTVNG